MYPLVVRAGPCAAFGEHRQAGAELLHSHGGPEWRQVGWHVLHETGFTAV